MTRPAYVEIDAQAFAHNLQQVRYIAPQSKILAIAKANAYGHGLLHVAHVLDEADAVGVACLEEAMEARNRGIRKPIVLMEGFFSGHELALICKHDFQVVLHSQEQIEILQRSKLRNPIHVWIKLDTGMHRLGFSEVMFPGILQKLQHNPKIIQPPYLMSHFACADELNKAMTQSQFEKFLQMTANAYVPKSIANSAAILAWPHTQLDWVRPGIMLYGISPFFDKSGESLGLIPVMTLRSQLIALHELQKGEPVGYGATWRSPENHMLVGVVAMGYGDGYPRQVPNGTPVLVNGLEVPLVGRVSMDMLTIDLRTQPHAKVGDPVVLWGKGLPVEIIAHAANTVGYELVCGINTRVHCIDHQICLL